LVEREKKATRRLGVHGAILTASRSALFLKETAGEEAVREEKEGARKGRGRRRSAR